MTSHDLPAAAGPPKLVHVLHSSEYPRTTFAVLDSMSCLVADNSLDAIFAQLKTFYVPRKGMRIEVKGQCCEVKQYVVKCGSVAIGSSSKGVVVEASGPAPRPAEPALSPSPPPPCRWRTEGVREWTSPGLL